MVDLVFGKPASEVTTDLVFGASEIRPVYDLTLAGILPPMSFDGYIASNANASMTGVFDDLLTFDGHVSSIVSISIIGSFSDTLTLSSNLSQIANISMIGVFDDVLTFTAIFTAQQLTKSSNAVAVLNNNDVIIVITDSTITVSIEAAIKAHITYNTIHWSDNMPAIRRRRGDTYAETITVTDMAGLPINITGYTFKLTVDRSKD